MASAQMDSAAATESEMSGQVKLRSLNSAQVNPQVVHLLHLLLRIDHCSEEKLILNLIFPRTWKTM